MDIDLFKRGIDWEAEKAASVARRGTLGWRLAAFLGALLAIAVIALASLVPLRRTIPYVVKVDSTTGNVEVLQTFDNRSIGRQELMDMYWAQTYVLAREQYNWWLIAGDYDLVNRLTSETIVADYNAQFRGDKALDKVFAESTERRIRILSVTPAPTVRDQMVVHFERTTVSKNVLVEPPTRFVVNMTFRYSPKTVGAVTDLIRNPIGFEVYAYRRDAEVAPSQAGPAGGVAKTGGAL